MATAELAHGEVHVWSDDLDPRPDRLRRLASLLSHDERHRAARFRFTRDQSRFVVGRGRLRELLGTYLGVRPSDVSLTYGPFGKPALAGHELHFNLSHSGSLVVYAFCRDQEVGVDVELSTARGDDELVARRFFAPREIDDLLTLPRATRGEAFLACWTRKEAYIKARGEGLSLPLQDFEVSLRPTEAPRLVRTAWSSTEASEWQLHDVSVLCPSSVAAVAVHGDELRIITHPPAA